MVSLPCYRFAIRSLTLLAGYAYCAISALSLLDRPLENSSASHPSKILNSGIRDMSALIHWLVSRQFVYLESTPKDDDSDSDDEVNFTLPQSLADLSLSENHRYVGLNGRCNKAADTCYCFWVGGALHILGRGDLIQAVPMRRFMLDKMQHQVGGFGKYPGSPPDVYHTCFGTVILGVMGEEGLNEVDSSLAVPVETVRRIEKARRELVRNDGYEGRAGELAKEIVSFGVALKRPGWWSAIEG